jgi:TonB family protein
MKPIIPLPCSEDWDKMKIGQFSRHCGVCDKSVVDFTQMSRFEILSYLIEHRNENVCGHVRLSQLDYRHEETLVVIRDLEKRHKNSNLSYFLLSMATLSLMSCEPQKESNHSIKPKQQIEQRKKNDNELKRGEIDLKPEVEKTNCKMETVEGIVDGGIAWEQPLGGAMVVEVQPPLPPEVIPEQLVTGEVYIPIERPKMIVEVMPEFDGGTDALMKYVRKHLHYPKWEKKNKIQGTVYATFVVDEMGNVSNPEIMRSVEGARNFDEEVLKVILSMPKWKPGMDGGKVVPVQFNLPFKFEL